MRADKPPAGHPRTGTPRGRWDRTVAENPIESVNFRHALSCCDNIRDLNGWCSLRSRHSGHGVGIFIENREVPILYKGSGLRPGIDNFRTSKFALPYASAKFSVFLLPLLASRLRGALSGKRK